MHILGSAVANLQSDITYLQLYINNRQRAGFFDMEKMVEILSSHIFKAIFSLDLKNKNREKLNHKAIDLADDKRRVSVQVTTNASSSKIKKTLEAFSTIDEHGNSIQQNYDELVIFGFCKKVSYRALPSWCTVYDMGDLIDMLLDRNSLPLVQEIVNALRGHVSYSGLHPRADKPSLQIILGFIDRDAIRHSMYGEGNVLRMEKALFELSELIGKGTVNAEIKSKHVFEFEDSVIVDYLLGVKRTISEILQLINKKRDQTTGYVVFTNPNMLKISGLKSKILDDSAVVATKYGLKFGPP